MSTENNLRVGIIGAGWAAKGHIAGFQACPGTEVVAIANRTKTKAEEFAQRFSIPGVFTDFRLMLEEDLDIVSITTSACTHYEMALAALEAGVHVVCEEPMAMNVHEAEQMYKAAKPDELKTAVGFTSCYSPADVYLKNLVDKGYVGTIREVRAYWPTSPPLKTAKIWFTQLEQGGGILANSGPHQISRVRRLLGREWCQEQPLEEYEIAKTTADTAYYFIADFEDEITVFLTCSPVKGEAGRRIEVYGDEGTLILEGGSLSGCAHDGKEFASVAIPEHLTRHPEGVPEDWLGYLWSKLLKEFIASVNGLDTNVPTFFDGLKCQEIMDAVW